MCVFDSICGQTTRLLFFGLLKTVPDILLLWEYVQQIERYVFTKLLSVCVTRCGRRLCYFTLMKSMLDLTDSFWDTRHVAQLFSGVFMGMPVDSDISLWKSKSLYHFSFHARSQPHLFWKSTETAVEVLHLKSVNNVILHVMSKTFFLTCYARWITVSISSAIFHAYATATLCVNLVFLLVLCSSAR